MSSADRVAPYRWATHAILSNTHALPAEYKCLNNKTRAIHFPRDFCWVSILACVFLRRHKFWHHRQFLLPNSRNEEMMGDGFTLVATAPRLL